MSLSTDITIINSFKEEAKEKGISRVTIGNVADRCGCARQTIYYHFHGTMDLLKWISMNEQIGATFDETDRTPWKMEVYRLLCTFKSNDWLFKDIYNSKYWIEYQDYLFNILQIGVVDVFFLTCSSYGSPKNRDSLARMLTYTFVGKIVDWMRDNFSDSPLEVLDDLSRLCGSAMHKLIEDFLILRPQPRSATVN